MKPTTFSIAQGAIALFRNPHRTCPQGTCRPHKLNLLLSSMLTIEIRRPLSDGLIDANRPVALIARIAP